MLLMLQDPDVRSPPDVDERGLVGGGVVSTAMVAPDLQMVQPERETEPSVNQVKVEPAATATLLGPIVP